MKIKSEKGFTGVDIAATVIILFIFVSVIAMLSYNISSTLNEVKYKGEATYIAINEIEKVKNLSFETFEGINKNSNGKTITIDDEEITIGQMQEVLDTDIQQGFYKAILVEDYNDIDSSKESDLVKKVTVRVSYVFKGKQKDTELSTLLTKEY